MGVNIKKWGEIGGGEGDREWGGGTERTKDLCTCTRHQISPSGRIYTCMCSSSGGVDHGRAVMANSRARGGGGLPFNSQV